MDFNHLPANVFLQILRNLPLKERVRVAAVNKRFREISHLEISTIKYLDVADSIFDKMKPDQLAIFLDLCKNSLEVLKFGTFDFDAGISLVEAFLEFDFTFPKLLEFDGFYYDGNFLKRHPNLRSLTYRFEGYFQFAPDLVLEKLERLDINKMDDMSLRCLIGRLPNLKHFETRLDRVSKDIFDDFFSSVPKLETLNLHVLFPSFNFGAMSHFWNLSALTSLTLNFVPPRFSSADSVFLRRISECFPNLEKLHLDCSRIDSRGVASLALLRNLRIVNLITDIDVVSDNGRVGLAYLARCQQLFELQISVLELLPTTFINLVRSCPDLQILRVRSISDIETPLMAADILDLFLDLDERSIEILFCDDDHKMIWKSELVKEALERLKENGGLEIKLG